MQRETKIKIIGTGVFIVLVLGMVYLIYRSNSIEEKNVVETITVIGNKLLSEKDYLAFTKLSDLSNKKLSLQIIRRRFEKHPYIFKANVKFVSEKEVKVFLTEKKIYGVIVRQNEPLFVAEGFEILPVFSNTKMIDIPFISNVEGSENLKPLISYGTEDIMQAFKIIDASGLTGSKYMKDIAEINLRNGGDVVLTFSGLSIPVIFGRGNEAGKSVYLDALLTNLLNGNDLAEANYIDLRFNSQLYIGKTKGAEL